MSSTVEMQGPVGTASARSRARARRGRQVSWLWATPALLLMIAMIYIADGAGAWYAFTNWSGESASASFVGLRNFADILRDPVSRSSLWHTLEIAAGFVIATNVIGLLLALGLRRTLKTRNFLRTLFFLPAIMSPLAVSYIWAYVLNYTGPLNSVLGSLGLHSARHDWLGSPTYALPAVLIVLVWQFSGLAMIFYLAGLQNISEELDEATAVDGASALYRFRRVTLPLLAPSITISLTFTLVLGLRVFDTIMGLTGGGPVNATQTLATEVYQQTWVNGRFGYGAALSVMLSFLVALVALVQLLVLRRRERRL